jgi:hypothetical protein
MTKFRLLDCRHSWSKFPTNLRNTPIRYQLLLRWTKAAIQFNQLISNVLKIDFEPKLTRNCFSFACLSVSAWVISKQR